MQQLELNDRMKLLEQTECGRRFLPLLPIMARCDGKCFSSWTSNLDRPYDARLSELMAEVTMELVKETNALIGYTQSDEISLVFYSDSYAYQVYFDGKIQKMVGDLAAFTSLTFNRLLSTYLPKKKDTMPRFDARVWTVPTLDEAANTLLWREIDATKNSLSMAVRKYYSHDQLDKKGRADQMDMLMQAGVNWNDYPTFFKRGQWVRARKTSEPFSLDELDSLPPMHAAWKNPELTIERKKIEVMDMPPFTSVINRVGVIFNGEDPVVLKV